eukprot:7379545-Prymnesium_polylepis.1
MARGAGWARVPVSYRVGVARLEDEVVGLDVAVHNPIGVQVGDGAGDLVDKRACVGLVERPLLLYSVEEVAAAQVLHHEEVA